MTKELSFDEVFDAQEQYRHLLNCMAKPGQIQRLKHFPFQPPQGLLAASTVVAFSLFNADVSFYTNNQQIAQYLSLNTYAHLAPIAIADFICLNGLDENVNIAQCKVGTLPYPEDSATLIVDVAQITQTPIYNSIQLLLQGPGIATTNTVYIQGIHEPLLQLMQEMNAEFPLGIDAIIVDTNYNAIAIPRSTKFNINNF